MAEQTIPRMSLVAHYDDLCRYSKVLTAGCEEQFKTFVESQRTALRRFRDTESEVDRLKKKIMSLEHDRKSFDIQIKHLKSLCDQEIGKRKKVELEKVSLERTIAVIKEVLLSEGGTIDRQTRDKLFMLSTNSLNQQISPPRLTTIEESMGSLLTDMDDTEEDLDPRLSKKRSRGRKSSSKRQKSSESDERTTDVPESDVETQFRKSSVTFMPSLPSVAQSNRNVPSASRSVQRSESEQIKGHNQELKRSARSHSGSNTPSGRLSLGSGMGRLHKFGLKTVIRPEKCNPCGQKIVFMKQAFRCHDCKITCHQECKDLCALPCLPAPQTPVKGGGSIADYVTSNTPMIPPIIVHCVNEIESRGMYEVGLYRISGTEREVKELKEKLLRGKSVPNMSQTDIHAVCGVLKGFLHSLKEPLLTYALRQSFIVAAENADENTCNNLMYGAACDLPQPNKETLAYVLLHLQKIAETRANIMTIESLATIFGPTIVGYSPGDPSHSIMLNDTNQQKKVMLRLLSIPSDSWQNLLNVDDVFRPSTQTPERTPAPLMTSRLGPIYSSAQKSKNVPVGRAPLTPRTAKPGSRPERKQFFSSPLLR